MAVKVGRRGRHVVAQLGRLDDARRRAACAIASSASCSSRSTSTSSTSGPAWSCCSAPARSRQGTFTVGDFALFVAYLDELTWYPAEIGRLLSDLKQIEVSFGRMRALVPGEPPAALVAPRADLPARRPPEPPRRRRRATGSSVLEVRGLTYRYPDSGRGVGASRSRLRARLVHGRDRARRRGQDDAAPGLARPAAARRRRDALERPAVDDPATFFVPPRSAYTPQVPRLFSETLRDNMLLGLARRSGRARRGDPRGGAGAATSRRSSAGSTRWSGRAA